MDALRILSMMVLVVLTIVGLDYYQQDKKHDGVLTANGYVDTIKHRFAHQQVERDAKAAEKARQKRWDAGAKSYLPEVAGWARYELTETGNDPVEAVLAGYSPTPLVSSIANPAELVRLSNGGQEAILRKLGETGLVYAKGEEIAWFDISLKPESARNTLAGIALARQQNFMSQAATKEGFAVIDGVAFMETTRDMLDPTADFPYRKIVGRIGLDEEVVIRLHTNAQDTTIRELLGALDYAGLNALLTFPSPVVGQGNVVSMDRQSDVAEKMNRLHSEMVAVQEKTADEKLRNLDMTAVLVNTMTSAGFNDEGVMDITGGEVFENQDVLQIGYGRAQQLLLESDQREANLEEPSEPKVADQAQSSGFFNALKAKLPAFGATEAKATSKAPLDAPKKAQPVRVHKGGLGASCAQIGNSKRCAVAGQ